MIPNQEELLKAFSSIEGKRSPLIVSTMICSVCGHVFRVKDKTSKPCDHLRELARDWKNGEDKK